LSIGAMKIRCGGQGLAIGFEGAGVNGAGADLLLGGISLRRCRLGWLKAVSAALG
jgi:hypothetical protein